MVRGFWSVSVISLGGALLLASCGGRRAASIDASELGVGTRWNAILSTPSDLVGAVQVQGTGWMAAAEDMDRTRAGITLTNATPGGEHPQQQDGGRPPPPGRRLTACTVA